MPSERLIICALAVAVGLWLFAMWLVSGPGDQAIPSPPRPSGGQMAPTFPQPQPSNWVPIPGLGPCPGLDRIVVITALA
jgi:hypothetical protein